MGFFQLPMLEDRGWDRNLAGFGAFGIALRA